MRSPKPFARCDARVSQRPLVLALAVGLGAAPLGCLAATISVTTPGDAGSATDCTLRQAIVSMNAGSVAGTNCTNTGTVFAIGALDAINFSTTLFPNGSPNTITLADASTSTLTITDVNLTIDASDNGQVTIQRSRLSTDATNAFGLIKENAVWGADAALTLKHLTLSNGKGSGSGTGAGSGGGIFTSYVNLTLDHCTLRGNSATQDGGGIYAYIGAVMLTNSTLTGNSASNFGGGISAHLSDVTLTKSTLAANSALSGGGISAYLEWQSQRPTARSPAIRPAMLAAASIRTSGSGGVS